MSDGFVGDGPDFMTINSTINLGRLPYCPEVEKRAEARLILPD